MLTPPPATMTLTKAKISPDRIVIPGGVSWPNPWFWCQLRRWIHPDNSGSKKILAIRGSPVRCDVKNRYRGRRVTFFVNTKSGSAKDPLRFSRKVQYHTKTPASPFDPAAFVKGGGKRLLAELRQDWRRRSMQAFIAPFRAERSGRLFSA
jgi:hypothetical protein